GPTIDDDQRAPGDATRLAGMKLVIVWHPPGDLVGIDGLDDRVLTLGVGQPADGPVGEAQQPLVPGAALVLNLQATVDHERHAVVLTLAVEQDRAAVVDDRADLADQRHVDSGPDHGAVAVLADG